MPAPTIDAAFREAAGPHGDPHRPNPPCEFPPSMKTGAGCAARIDLKAAASIRGHDLAASRGPMQSSRLQSHEAEKQLS